MKELRNVTLVFLIKKLNGEIKEICLAMKKRGFGVNRWNGVGGKVVSEETIEEAAQRETKEEIGVAIKNLSKVAELSFYFPHQPDWDQLVHVYFTENWEGEPDESEEMKPQWFRPGELPFQDMWPDDKFWLPEVINGNHLKALFKFGKNDNILEKEITMINKL